MNETIATGTLGALLVMSVPAFATGAQRDQGAPPAVANQPPALTLVDAVCATGGTYAFPKTDPPKPAEPVQEPDGSDRPAACSFAVSSSGGQTRWVLRVRSLGPGGLLSVVLKGNATAWLPDSTTVEVASDAAAADHEVLLPPGFNGKATVDRLDLGTDALPFEVTLAPASSGPRSADSQALAELADRGQTLRVSVPTRSYAQLVTLAGGAAARDAQQSTIKEQVLSTMSAIIGRGTLEKASTKSEPIVIFVGVAGTNRIILSDEVARPMVVAHDNSGKLLAEPWQTTFERAAHFWAVYVEEDRAPFNTSIDVGFTRRTADEDRDDFDPQGVARRDTQSAGSTIPVRVGFKRFRMPDNFDVAKVTFSRQSSSYGLRQWSKAFTRYGRFAIRLAGSAAAVVPTIERRDFTLVPVYVDAALEPGAYSIDVARRTQVMFAALSIRLPQLRESERQAPFGLSRYWRSFVPEPTFGFGLPTVNGTGFSGQSLLVAGSWPVVGDRVHFLLGAVRVQEPHEKPGYGTPKRIPSPLPLDEIREMRGRWQAVLGLSIDLVRTW